MIFVNFTPSPSYLPPSKSLELLSFASNCELPRSCLLLSASLPENSINCPPHQHTLKHKHTYTHPNPRILGSSWTLADINFSDFWNTKAQRKSNKITLGGKANRQQILDSGEPDPERTGPCKCMQIGTWSRGFSGLVAAD